MNPNLDPMVAHEQAANLHETARMYHRWAADEPNRWSDRAAEYTRRAIAQTALADSADNLLAVVASLPGEQDHNELAARHLWCEEEHRAAAGELAEPVALEANRVLTQASLALFDDLCREAGNWNGQPLVDLTAEQRGNLSHLKRWALLDTRVDDGCTWANFRVAGMALAELRGHDLSPWLRPDGRVL